MADLLTLNNSVFASFVFHSSVVLAKMLVMAPLTSLYRMRWKVSCLGVVGVMVAVLAM